MNFVLAGKAKDVFQRLKDFEVMSAAGGDIIYEGYRIHDEPGNVIVTRTEVNLNGEIKVDNLYPGPSQELYNHSPDGFEWGYSGSGPAQLALALILDATGNKELALVYHQQFKESFVAGWGARWQLIARQIRIWVELKHNLDQLAAKEEKVGTEDKSKQS